MASLQQEPTGVFHIVVRINGKRFKRSLATKSESQAILNRDEITEMIDLVKRGKVQVPDNVPIIDFVLSGGRLPAPKPIASKEPKPTATKSESASLSLTKAFDQFLDSIPSGNIEDDTIKMLKIHQRHLLRILKPSFDLTKLTGQKLQSYINKRSKEKTQYFLDKADRKSGKANSPRKPISATTIRKEVTTLGSLWRWAATIPLVSGPFPNRGLRYPKTDEKPPFQTWAEIERQIEVGQLNFHDSDTLWDCLYLRSSEIDQLLNYTKQNANYDFVYPMFAMAAFTGARRSELMRSNRSDFDFDSGIVTIRERKRVKGRRSTRRVPLTEKLRNIMQDWFENHPGGTATFSQIKFGKSRKPFPITRDQAQSHFRQTLKGSRWDCIKGWHCLRHSFISNLACAGIDQRIIDEFVGHTSDEMRRRYRHLFPDVKHAAINKVFG